MSESCDKNWMTIIDKSSPLYREGVQNFIDFAYKNRIRDSLFCICPCRVCRNRKSWSFATVRQHLLVSGMFPFYVCWSLHGEKFTRKPTPTPTPASASAYVVQENVEVEEEILVEEILEENRRDDTLHDFVDAAFGLYEGLDEGVNAGLDEGVNEGLNGGVNEHQEPNLGKKHDKYKKLAEERIYPTCDNGATTLSVIVELHHAKKRFGWSGNSVTYLLGLLRKWFPDGNTFPAKYPVMKEMLKDLGMKAENIHCCPNHCVLYRKELKDEKECPSCGVSRYKLKEGKDGVMRPTKEPASVLRHFPLPERLKKYYTIPWIAEEMTWHDRAEVSREYMRHPVDSPQWQNMKRKWPKFADEARNVWLGISTDGFNPRGIQCTAYSCWPVILVPYNLPPSLCMKAEFQIMSLLIPGPKASGADICVFLPPLIDDLTELWEGVDAVDMHRKEKFRLHAILMWGIHDLPAYGNVSGCTVHGYKACPGCRDETESNWLTHSKKIVYRNFRRFLKSNHPFRDGKYLGLSTVEKRLAPSRISGEQILKKTSRMRYIPGKVTREGTKRKRDFYDSFKAKPSALAEAFYKRSRLFDIPTWVSNPYQHCLDVMHCEKNFIEHLVNAFLNTKNKSKDSIEARLDMQELNIQKGQWITRDSETGKVLSVPDAPYILNNEERTRFLTILKSVKFPTGFCSNLGNNVTLKPPGLHCLKSHDYHIIMECLLPVLLQHAFPRYPDLRRALQQICLFFRILCSKVLIKEELQKAKYMVAEAMCVLEKYFPPSFFVISIHLVVHLADEALTCGPVRYRWMYPFERAMKSFKNIPGNKRFVEGNIKESQLVAEGVIYAMEHVANSKEGNHKATREAFLDADTEYSDEGPVGYGDKIVNLTAVQFIQIVRWVLFRREIEGLADYYVEYCDELSRNTNELSSISEVERQTRFISWLYKKLEKEGKMNSKLWRYVKGPVGAKEFTKYRVNGFTFSPKSHELKRVTQDSGVCLTATTTYRASRKDKNPVDDVTKWYGVVNQILELDYTDFTEVVFYCDWVKVESRSRGCKLSDDGNLVLVNLKNFRSSQNYYDEPAILDFEASQVFYSTDLKSPDWSVVLHSKRRLTTQVDDTLKPQFEDFQSIFDDEPHLKDLLTLKDT